MALAALLSAKLPVELAEDIARIAAIVHLQAAARGLLARRRRAPPSDHGFARRDSAHRWAFATDAPDRLCERLEAWSRVWRPGVYELELVVTHEQGVATTFGSERVTVTPTTTHWTPGDLADTLHLYLAAVTRFHGPLADASITLLALSPRLSLSHPAVLSRVSRTLVRP